MKEPSQQDHYRVLGVTYTATNAQIKKSFHQLAKQLHPDRNTPSRVVRSTEEFQKLQAAYETLTDAQTRKAYNVLYPAIKQTWAEYDRHVKVWEAKRQKRSRFTQEVLVIHSKNDEFKVHGHILKDRSAFFKQKINAATNEIRLTDDDDIVAAYVHCVYHGDIQTELSDDILEAEQDGMPVCTQLEYLFLARLYGFGEKVLDTQFQSEVISKVAAIIDRRDEKGGRHFPNARYIKAIYNVTPRGSPARQMMIDLYAENAGKHWFPEYGYEHFHPEFAYDLVREVLVHRTQAPPKGLVIDRVEKWHKMK